MSENERMNEKLIFLFSFCSLATTKGGDKAEGTIEVPNLSEEFEQDELEVI